jgi:hypothetical protein
MMPKCSICKKKTIKNKHVMLEQQQQLKQLKQRHCPTSVFFIIINLQNKIFKSFFFFSENTKRNKYLLKQSLKHVTIC